MYYAWNSLTGRLVGTTYLKAYNAQGLQTLRPPDPVNPFALRATHRAPPAAKVTTVAKSADGIAYSPVPEKLKRMQEHFQKPDGLPVHLKGGPVDKVLLYTTVALGVVGLGLALQNVYKIIFPKPFTQE